MNVRRIVPYVGSCALSVLVASSALSHDDKNHDDRNRAGELVRQVRDATARFRDSAAAEAEGYQLMFGCVTGPDSGAMGLHYVNMSLVGDGVLDACATRNRDLRAAAERAAAPRRRRLPGARRGLAREARGTAGARRTAHAPVRESRIVSVCRRSIRCTSGRGRTTRPACS